MGKATGFIEFEREVVPYRDATERMKDFGEIFTNPPEEHLQTQGGGGEGDGVPDGLKVDLEGRIYCTGVNGCWVFAPDGEQLGMIELPEIPANVGWGGEDYRTLLFTARTSLYSVRMNVAGVVPPGAR